MVFIVKALFLSLIIKCLTYSTVVDGKQTYNEDIDYFLIYKSHIISNNNISSNTSSTITTDILNTNNLGFSNGLNNYSLLPNMFNTSLYVCQNECSLVDKCQGIFIYTDINTKYNTTNCRYLPEILEPSILNMSSSSYLKVKHHTYNNTHDIEGKIYDTYSYKDKNENITTIINSTVYIDENHNGILDNNEQYINTNNNENFKFKNVNTGSYLIRQIIPEGCYQFYPGLYGNYLDKISYSDTYVDDVIYYYEIPHASKILKHGGNIKTNKPLTTIDYSYIVGNNPDLYFTFYPKNIITFSFIDESIIDTEGDDIFIKLYKSTNIKANVYISHNNINYYKIGILSNEKHSFDIKSTTEKIPISFIKLEFDVNDYNYDTMYESMNIISINGELNSVYNPSYSYYITIPGYHTVLFYNDCHYKFSCTYYCIFNTISDNDYYSCLYGCNVFKIRNVCDCNINSFQNKNIKFEGTAFNYKSCLLACSIAIKKYIYPDYTLLERYTGYDNYEISNDINHNNHTEECLDTMITDCNNNNCSSFSFLNNMNANNNMNATFYNLPYYKESYNHNLIINTKYSESLSYYTPTITSTTTTDTSTTTTDTSTTTTDTSTTTTDTSTTTTDTSTTTTDTSTTTTDTSTTTTDTSTTTTDTSTTITDTSTTTTDTSTTTTDTSTTTTYTSIDTITPIIQLSSNNNNDYLYYTIPIIIMISMSIFIIIILSIIKCKNVNQVTHRGIDYSFANPLYNSSNTDTFPNNSDEEYNYQDFTENHEYNENNEKNENNENYINVLPTINTESISSDL